MNDQDDLMTGQVHFLQALVDQHAQIAGDILAINTSTWAIHGTIPVDGDVLMAEFDDREQAQAVLQHLAWDLPEPVAAEATVTQPAEGA